MKTPIVSAMGMLPQQSGGCSELDYCPDFSADRDVGLCEGLVHA
jgi:hypothetical protein